ncbi:hypothetical protein LAZ67_17001850 [Cordylochernes scorpioides]|uniref:Uncharacterized protein n=1 Tax=Cordylochernes scorpioides TaxID=51811 RepID=A0ABY6LHT9_9ARAC|nr:hypothetical protein LAZ67_17001850 [Cordylochernes scorpioides]
MEQQLPARMSLDVTGVFFSTRHQLSAWKSGVIKCLGFWAKRLLSNLNAKEQEYQITALIYLMGERAEEIHSAFNLSADDAKCAENM